MRRHIFSGELQIKGIAFLLLLSVGAYAEDKSPLRFSGDLRLRYEGIFDRDVADQARAQIRFRVGISKKIENQIELIGRFATANTPTSRDVSLSGSFSVKNWGVDQAYLVYRPSWYSGLKVLGGKMKNPLYYTRMVWDEDVTPEGLAELFIFPKVSERIDIWANFAQYFHHNTIARANADGTVFAFQGGLVARLNQEFQIKAGGGYYHWTRPDAGGINGISITTLPAGTSSDNLVRKNDLLSHFQVIEGIGELDMHVGKIPVVIQGDYIHNTVARSDTNGIEYNDGWLAGLRINHLEKPGDWRIRYSYASIDQDATPAGITDNDFGHVNRRGHVVRMHTRFARNTDIGLTYYLLTPIRRNPFGQDIPDRTLVHLDVQTKF